ncbi:hypothetical protein G4228_019738 [Cervus hanglu yarkandensis]|uniref:BRCT domain-containing protein n=1 Tax=Cervus hanglu yarkandensis TaxID=84702 RepID=A0A833RYW1_9CERV|nr:hypothetical protein G4228_019738 [Cervus hanglu yarkandensis]
MSGQAPRVPEEMFKEAKYYTVGDLDPQVIQLLKAGKAKEVSYSALASHIISEDGDNPEVGEAREVFDLPVVKPSWVILSVQCGALLPVNGFSPESCQIFFGITACLSQVSPEDRSALWAMLTFHRGGCQLNLNKKCTHLVVPPVPAAAAGPPAPVPQAPLQRPRPPLPQQHLQHLQRLQQMQQIQPAPTAQPPGPPAQALQPPPPQAQEQPPLF